MSHWAWQRSAEGYRSKGGAADMQGWDSFRLETASRLILIIIFFKFRNGKFAYKGLI